MKCTCGCDDEARWIVKSFDFDPHAVQKLGEHFEEPCCYDAMMYLVESAEELGFPVEREIIKDIKL